MKRRNLEQIHKESGDIANFVRSKRKSLGYTQEELALRVGVGLRFLKELELGKKTLQIHKVEQVLNYFGYHLAPAPKEKDNES
jgi:y4mF family transcriptional regulator